MCVCVLLMSHTINHLSFGPFLSEQARSTERGGGRASDGPSEGHERIRTREAIDREAIGLAWSGEGRSETDRARGCCQGGLARARGPAIRDRGLRGGIYIYIYILYGSEKIIGGVIFGGPSFGGRGGAERCSEGSETGSAAPLGCAAFCRVSRGAR